MTRKAAVIITAISALIGQLSTHDRVNADHIVIKIATTAPEGTPIEKQLLDLKSFITKETQGWVRVKIFTGGSLGDDKKLVERTLNGTIQVFAGTADCFCEKVPEVCVLQAPYLFSGEAHAARALEGPVSKQLASLLPDRGFVLSMLTEYGFRSWFTKQGPIRRPGDLKTLRLPVRHADKAQQELFRILEIAAVEMNVTEVRENLRRGTLDGFESTPVEAAASSWYRSVKHLTLSEHSYQPGIVVYSKKWFDGLPERLKVSLARIPNQLVKDERIAVRALNANLLTNMQQRGIEIYRPSSKEKGWFIRYGDRISKALVGAAGGGGRNILQAIRRTR
ncbi:MAG: TRAP transporter substrate-binding protein DctP [Deltaproteobacteria bacterium]|nr:TRAP transporter substrate-binding protein DctP [Deltaproteobacteria bacterium]